MNADLGPNWFAAVMGTGIVAVAAHGLPVQVAGQRQFAFAVWALAAALLVLLLTVVGGGWLVHPHRLSGHLQNPVMAHFFGAVPMALLTVGAGALLTARDVAGLHTVLVIDGVLWTLGTVSGLACSVVVLFWAITRHATTHAFGGWLMPVVPPMVSATTGGFLAPYLPAGQARNTLLLACGLMFGWSLVASLVVITQIWNRLLHNGIGEANWAPAWWIVLGPVGQSITAAGVLSAATGSRSARAAGILYGVAALGFALFWLALAVAITIATALRGLPFTLSWWSFTFPLGTVVTGTSQLAAHTGLATLDVVATVLFAGLIAAWATVFTRTVLGLPGLLPVPAVVTTEPVCYAI